MNNEEVANQIRSVFAPRIIDDEFDKGWAAAIERVAKFIEKQD